MQWVVLGEKKAEYLEKSDVYVTSLPLVPLLDYFVRPVLQNRGKGLPLLPLYIQCRSCEDAEEVVQLYHPLLKLYTARPYGKELARSIHTSLDCSNIMDGVIWYVLLNGRSFRGLLFSVAYVLFILQYAIY